MEHERTRTPHHGSPPPPPPQVHIFFANEGLNDFKCYTGAMESFVGKVGIPAANVRRSSVPLCHCASVAVPL
jgi:hypothetical protein